MSEQNAPDSARFLDVSTDYGMDIIGEVVKIECDLRKLRATDPRGFDTHSPKASADQSVRQLVEVTGFSPRTRGQDNARTVPT